MRVFALRPGMPQDPATGSANGALGAYLVHHASTSSALCASVSSALRRIVPLTELTTHILSEQGAEIDRPSTLHVEVDSAGEEISAVNSLSFAAEVLPLLGPAPSRGWGVPKLG